VQKASKVFSVSLVTDNHFSVVLQPREHSLDYPPPLVAAQRSPILRRWPDAVAAMRRDQFNALLGKDLI